METPARFRIRWQMVALIASLAAGIIPAYAFRATTELAVYVRAAGRFVEASAIYRLNEGLPPFAYPPAFAVPFVPLVPLGEAGQRVIWAVVQAALVAVMLCLLRSVGEPIWRRAKADGVPNWTRNLYILLLVILGGRFLLSPLENMSHDLVIGVLILSGAWYGGQRRDVAAGVAFGVAAALKATPLLFLPVLVWQRRWRAALAMTLAIVVVSVLPDLIRPSAEGPPHAVRWAQIATGAAVPGQSGGSKIWAKWNHLNQNLAGTLYRLTAPAPERFADRGLPVISMSPPQQKWMTSGAQLLVLMLVGAPFLFRRLIPEGDFHSQRMLEAGIIGCGMLLLSPMSSKAHFVILLAPLCVVLADVIWRRRDLFLILMLALVAVGGVLTAKSLIGRGPSDLLLASGSQTLVAFSLLLAGVRASWLRARTSGTHLTHVSDIRN